MSDIYISKEHFTHTPDCTGRPDKERRVYELLERLDIPFEGVDHEVAPTIEACRGIEEELGIMPCKNLFLRNRQKTMFYLLLMPGDKKFLTKDLSHQLGISRLSFAEPEYMEQYLDITPESVSVMGLMNDHENRVQLLIDEDVLKGEYLGCHPCQNTSSIKFRTSDLLDKFLPAVHHHPIIVRL